MQKVSMSKTGGPVLHARHARGLSAEYRAPTGEAPPVLALQRDFLDFALLIFQLIMIWVVVKIVVPFWVPEIFGAVL